MVAGGGVRSAKHLRCAAPLAPWLCVSVPAAHLPVVGVRVYIKGRLQPQGRLIRREGARLLRLAKARLRREVAA